MEQEATKIAHDLNNDYVGEVADKLFKKIKEGQVPISLYRGSKVYQFGDSGVGYICLVHDSKVVYFVRHKRIKYSGFKLGRQVLLCGSKEQDPVTAGFAQTIFFKVLLPKYRSLIADKEQTHNGVAFWGNAIASAFSKNLHVYCFDRRHGVKLTELFNEEDVGKFSSTLWGNTPAHVYTFAVISDRPLALKESQI